MPYTVQSGGAPDNVGHQSNLRGVNFVRVGGKFRLKERIGSGSFGWLKFFRFCYRLTGIHSRNCLPWNQHHFKGGSRHQARVR
jgi:hypothetical protein